MVGAMIGAALTRTIAPLALAAGAGVLLGGAHRADAAGTGDRGKL